MIAILIVVTLLPSRVVVIYPEAVVPFVLYFFLLWQQQASFSGCSSPYILWYGPMSALWRVLSHRKILFTFARILGLEQEFYLLELTCRNQIHHSGTLTQELPTTWQTTQVSLIQHNHTMPRILYTWGTVPNYPYLILVTNSFLSLVIIPTSSSIEWIDWLVSHRSIHTEFFTRDRVDEALSLICMMRRYILPGPGLLVYMSTLLWLFFRFSLETKDFEKGKWVAK